MGIAALIGRDFESETGVGVYLFIVLTILVVLPVFVLDGRWWAKRPEAAPWRRTIIERLARLQGILFPQRLVLPVQLALESNMPRGTFTIMFMLLIFATAILRTRMPTRDCAARTTRICAPSVTSSRAYR
jgi:hypothetical protein